MIRFDKLSSRLRELVRCTSGISIVEFALVLPVLLTMGLYGTEIARMASTKMQVSQIALTVADNASRLGQTDNSVITPTITEADVDAVLDGALRQGRSINLETQGRVILSSLEYHQTDEKQFIHWQRCRGDKDMDSFYGNDSTENGISGAPLPGMGRGSTKITARGREAVMFVEIYYTYDGLFANPFGSGDAEFREEAAFLIRDDRDLRGPDEPGLVAGPGNSPCD